MTILSAPNIRDIGSEAEDAGCRFLQQQGLTILQRNFHSRGGELDIIARDGQTTVFVEVRYRKNNRFGTAAETVTSRKQQKIQHAALTWLKTDKRASNGPSRFDVIAITGEPSGQTINWIKNAFEYQSGY